MTTPKAFKDLEAFSEYPQGYEPVVETQQQLIVQSVKKSKHQRQIAVILAIAASVVLLVFSDQRPAVSRQPTAVSRQPTADSGQPTADSRQRSVVSRQPISDSGQQSVILDRKSVIGDRFSVIGDEGAVYSSQPKTKDHEPKTKDHEPKTKDQGPKTNSQQSADSRQPKVDSGQPSTEIFLAKQRFKQFEFNRPPEAVKRPQEEKKKTEFFVFQNGNFKIINRPNQSQNTLIYTK